MELQGKVKVKGETKTFGEKGFRKRDLVITTDEQYPQDILVEFTQDNTDLLDKFNVGNEVKIGINIRGREWTNPQGEVKYFNSIQGWMIEADEVAPMEQAKTTINNALPEDDLPF